jgi:hypothetical protein
MSQSYPNFNFLYFRESQVFNRIFTLKPNTIIITNINKHYIMITNASNSDCAWTLYNSIESSRTPQLLKQIFNHFNTTKQSIILYTPNVQ